MTDLAACPHCASWHTTDQPCLYDDCQSCGGVYPYGPSTSELCGICAEGAQTAMETPAPRALRFVAAWPDEEPF